MTVYLVTIALILGIGLLGVMVDRVYRRFANRHPQLGPFRSSEKGCGCCSKGCGSGTSCSR